MIQCSTIWRKYRNRVADTLTKDRRNSWGSIGNKHKNIKLKSRTPCISRDVIEKCLIFFSGIGTDLITKEIL